MWSLLALVANPTINQKKMLVISAWDCHLIHDNGIGLLSTAAMKCLHWSLFCETILSENFRTNFSNKYVLQKDEFSNYVFQSGRVFFRTSFHWTVHLIACGRTRCHAAHLGMGHRQPPLPLTHNLYNSRQLNAGVRKGHPQQQPHQ